MMSPRQPFLRREEYRPIPIARQYRLLDFARPQDIQIWADCVALPTRCCDPNVRLVNYEPLALSGSRPEATQIGRFHIRMPLPNFGVADLAYLSKVLDEADGVTIAQLDGRMAVQKKVYLLQAFGVNLGYTFEWNTFGPYC